MEAVVPPHSQRAEADNEDGKSVSEAVLPRVARGDEKAVQECLDRYGSLVWSLARRLLGSSSEAEDAVQEVFVELWKHAARFDERRSSETTFVAMIARRRFIDRIRRNRRKPEHETLMPKHENIPGHRESQAADRLAEAALAARALDDLRPEQKQVLQMVIQDGLTHQQVAEATGMPLGTVKTHARRGLLRLRSMLMQEEPMRSWSAA